jgi:Ser/Thr protein kinase RdoA (MazF antagonist)
MMAVSDDGVYSQTTIDFDLAQRSWFIVDVGTVNWTANMELFLNYGEGHQEVYEQYRTWFLEAYEWPTTIEELE